MQENEKNKNDSPGSSYLKYSGMGLQMIVIIGGFSYAGHAIDKSANHRVQWVTAALALLGVFVSLFLIIRSVRND